MNENKHDEYSNGSPNGETITEQVHHELDLALDLDTIAFFGVVLTKKSLLVEFDTTGDIPMPIIDGERSNEIVPTMIEIDQGLSASDKERFARGIIELGRNILRSTRK
jgi:hypothetical protein